MKKSYISAIVAIAMAGAFTACDENSWNDKLDGFDEVKDAPIEDVQTVEYTLTDNDYKEIASNATNKALAEQNGVASELAALTTTKAFSDKVKASDYMPAFLSSTAFPYFTLNNGSAAKITYNEQVASDPVVAEAATPLVITVADDFYMEEVWESDENYINAFAPSKDPAKFIPSYLSEFADERQSTYAVVSYKLATQEPVFGSVDEPETPAFELSSVIGDLKKDDSATINGVVTAICSLGYMLADNTGTIFVYMGSSFDAASVQVGNQLTVDCTIGAYNGGLQVNGSSATVSVVGNQAVTYPTAKTYTGAELDQVITREGNHLGIYCNVTGKVVVTEKNINLVVDGAETAQGSAYGISDGLKAFFTNDATQTITGYFIAVAGKRYCSIVVTAVDGKAVSTPAVAKVIARSVPQVAMTSVNAVYHYDGSKWVVPANFTVLQAADYTDMGQNYPNLSTAEPYLSIYLGRKFPYAAEGDVRNVLWQHYANSTTKYECSQYIFNGSEWTPNNNITEATTQFVVNGGKWLYDPNVTINLPAGRGVEISTLYFQTCVDWVFENICRPLGDDNIKSGKFYVSSYGNNEYYAGTSAYQGNVDLRPSAARDQYPAAYEGMSDEEIVALEKKHFMEEVMPGALAKLHPEAKPLEGLDVLYTINFVVYTGASTNYTAVFKVVAPGTFEPVSCTWDD